MSKQRSTLSKESFALQHSTMLFRHCCWCGRGITAVALFQLPAQRSGTLCRFYSWSDDRCRLFQMFT